MSHTFSAHRRLWRVFLDRLFPFRTRRQPRRQPITRARPFVEPLEDRLAPATFSVSDLLDAAPLNAGTNNPQDVNGAISLRSAIAAANVDAANRISDSINCNSIPSGSTLTLTQGVLELMAGAGTITIDGSGQAIVIEGDSSQVFLVDSGAQATLANLTIEHGTNTTGAGGGIDNAGTLTVSNCTITACAATDGSGVYNLGTMTLSGDTVSDNTGTAPGTGDGAGIENDGTMTVSGCTITGNSTMFVRGTNTQTAGGGILNYATMTVADSTIAGNTAELVGGVANYGTMTLSGCTIAGNTGEIGRGHKGGFACTDGGVQSGSGTLTLANCTVANNSGTGVDNGGVMTVTDSTVTGNSTGTQPAGGMINSGTLTLLSTIVAGNTLSTGAVADIASPQSGAALSGSYNFIGDGDNEVGLTNGNSGNQIGTQAKPLDPMLSPLGDYGGPTQTMTLLPGSQAIDNGGPIATVTQLAEPGATSLVVDAPAAIARTTGTYAIEVAGQQLVVTDVDLSTNTLTLQAPLASAVNTGADIFLATDQRGHPRVINGQTLIGAFAYTSDTTPPTATLNASAVTDASIMNSNGNVYTFSILFQDDTYVSASSVAAATAQVTLSSRALFAAQLTDTTLSGALDGVGDASAITADYKLIPPGGDWAQAPNGTYTVVLSGPPVTDTSGNALQSNQVGTFTVSTSMKMPVSSFSATNPIEAADSSSTSMSGMGEAGSRVSVIATDGTVSTGAYTTVVGANGMWTIGNIDVSGLADGTITYSATTTNSEGTQTSTQVTATKDTQGTPASMTYDVAPGYGTLQAAINEAESNDVALNTLILSAGNYDVATGNGYAPSTAVASPTPLSVPADALKFSVNSPVVSGNGSSASLSGTVPLGDDITVSVSDGTNTTNTYSATPLPNGAWTISNIDLRSLADGPITYTVTASNPDPSSIPPQQTSTQITAIKGGQGGSVSTTYYVMQPITIMNLSGVDKALIIVGAGLAKTIVQPGSQPGPLNLTQPWTYRIATIVGGAGLTVALDRLTITGGHDTVDAEGGGILVAGGEVTVSNAAVSGNAAGGARGGNGANGGTGAGAGAHNGGKAQGGGIYLASGTLNIINSSISGNAVIGGAGGQGGAGAQGSAGSSGSSGVNGHASAGPGGDGQAGQSGQGGAAGDKGSKGGNGGQGGEADGGGIYVNSGTLTMLNSLVSGNLAEGGAGGPGGRGGAGGSGGDGGDGGKGGAARPVAQAAQAPTGDSAAMAATAAMAAMPATAVTAAMAATLTAAASTLRPELSPSRRPPSRTTSPTAPPAAAARPAAREASPATAAPGGSAVAAAGAALPAAPAPTAGPAVSAPPVGRAARVARAGQRRRWRGRRRRGRLRRRLLRRGRRGEPHHLQPHRRRCPGRGVGGAAGPGGKGANGGLGGLGGYGGAGGSGGHGGDVSTAISKSTVSGGNGGNGGGGASGGDGGDGGDGGKGGKGGMGGGAGNGSGGGIYQSQGSIDFYGGSVNGQSTGGKGGIGAAGGNGGNGGDGGTGGHGGTGGAGGEAGSLAEAPASVTSTGNGGNGGNGAAGGDGGDGGAAGDGGDGGPGGGGGYGSGGGLISVGGSIAAFNGTALAGAAQGGLPAVGGPGGLAGSPGDAGDPGHGGSSGARGIGFPYYGFSGTAGPMGDQGDDGDAGNSGSIGSPGLLGGSAGDTGFGSFLVGGSNQPPQRPSRRRTSPAPTPPRKTPIPSLSRSPTPSPSRRRRSPMPPCKSCHPAAPPSPRPS